MKKEFASNMASTLLVGMNGSGDASSTTQAAVSDGSIIVRDKDNQQQDVATLSRDAEHANQTLSPIFDKEKEQQRIKEAQLIGEIGSQMSDILRTEGKIAGEKAKTDPAALAAAKEKLAADGNLNPTSKEIADQAYATAMKPWGTGSTMQQAVQAATAAVQGLAGGNIGQAISGAAAPYLAKVIHDMTTTKDANGKDVVNTEANLMAHAVLGAVVASAQGNSALAGASGAALGEYIAQQMYPGVPKDKLTEEQKQTISALGTLAAGLVGGIAGDSTADAVAGAQAGKNALEHNALGDGWDGLLSSGEQKTGQAVSSYVEYAQKNNLPPEQVQAGLENIIRGDLPESADIVKAILSNNPGSDTVMALLTAEEAKDYALALLTSIPAERVLALVSKTVNVIDNKVLISAAEKISTAKPGKQFTQPRDLNEQVFWSQVKDNPSNGVKFSDKGLDFNTDDRFPSSAGFEKMRATHELPNGKVIEIHYQYNSITNKAYDMKIVTPQRYMDDPASVLNNIKESVK